mmetsp:Transcript_110945/g.294800  ORF Transcript_110945/g.294800 Transcript_110945/m.294800 type:complete len:247 (+) Transcript_110945:1868-2608(+)
MWSSDIPHFSTISISLISWTAFMQLKPASMNFGRYSSTPALINRSLTSMWPSWAFSASAAPSSTVSSPTVGRDLLQSIIHPPLLRKPASSSILLSANAAASFLAGWSLSASSRAPCPPNFSFVCSPEFDELPFISSRFVLTSISTGAGGVNGGSGLLGCVACGGGGAVCVGKPCGCMPGCCTMPVIPGTCMPCDCICCIMAGDHIMTSREYCSVPCVAARIRPSTTAVGSLAPMSEPRARTICWYS